MRGAGVVAVVAAGALAFVPLEPVAVEPVTAPQRDDVAAAAEDFAPIDPAAFDVRLWNPGESAAAPVQAAAPVAGPPPDLVLVGITRVEGGLVATILDRREGAVHLVEDGGRLDEFEVTVEARGVALVNGDRRHVLELAEVDR